MPAIDRPPGAQDMMDFALVDALLGRRSRRFFQGAEIPDGVFAYSSGAEPLPLTDLEKLLVVGACSGNTSWHHMIFRGQRYAPHLANYAGAAGGRTFPSSAGFETSKTFFTDDAGVYLVEMRDAPAFAERAADGSLSLDEFVDNVRMRRRKIKDGRLGVPSEPPFTEAHNTWVFNKPSTLVVIPVGDVSQHLLLGLCYLLQNGTVLYDDVNKRAIPGIEGFGGYRGYGQRLAHHRRGAVGLRRGERGAGNELLRRRPDAPGPGTRGMDVQRRRSIHRAGSKRRSPGSRIGLPL